MKIEVEKKVLVPIEFSDFCANTVNYALSLFPKEKLRLIHVAIPPTAATPGVMWGGITDESIVKSCHEVFGKFCEDHQLPRDLDFTVEIGEPAEEIALEAAHHPADLIIVSSHGRKGLSRFFLGSVAERVVRFAHCPVLVFKPEEIAVDRKAKLAEIDAKTRAMFEPAES